MNKEELLQELGVRVASGEISRDDVLVRLNYAVPAANPPAAFPQTTHMRLSLTKMLYGLGAAVVTIGLIFFMAQIWGDIGAPGRILVTLGVGLMLAGGGSFFLQREPQNHIGPILHAVGGLMITGGILVVLSEMNISSIWSIAWAFGIAALFYIGLAMAQRRSVLIFFAVAHGTVFFYSLTAGFIDALNLDSVIDIYAYLTMALGAAYLLLAHSFRSRWRIDVLLSLLGSIMVLGAAFSQIFDSDLWLMAYFFLVLGVFIFAIYIKRSEILLVSTLALLAYVSYITGKYFADSIGWPVALIFLGFIFIGLGYASVEINKKYIKSS